MDQRLKCPHCGTRMTQIDARGTTIDWCEFCQGLWFDPTELARVLSTRPPLHNQPHPFEGQLPHRGICGMSCPRCRPASMESVGWDDVAFSRCGKCTGIFLDRPQMDAVRRHFQEGPEQPDSGDVAAMLGNAGSGLSGVAELLWTVARMVGRITFRYPF